MKKQGGFTVIEMAGLLVLVGILAAIAIPEITSLRMHYRQHEAKHNLKIIKKLEASYYAVNKRYTPSLKVLGWAPAAGSLYEYSVGTDKAGNPDPGGSPAGNRPAFANTSGFNAVAWGNIDLDPVIDTWEISDSYDLRNTSNDNN